MFWPARREILLEMAKNNQSRKRQGEEWKMDVRALGRRVGWGRGEWSGVCVGACINRLVSENGKVGGGKTKMQPIFA